MQLNTGSTQHAHVIANTFHVSNEGALIRAFCTSNWSIEGNKAVDPIHTAAENTEGVFFLLFSICWKLCSSVEICQISLIVLTVHKSLFKVCLWISSSTLSLFCCYFYTYLRPCPSFCCQEVWVWTLLFDQDGDSSRTSWNNFVEFPFQVISWFLNCITYKWMIISKITLVF